MMKSITKNTTPFSREIVFIDPSVEDCSTLAAGVKPGAEVHILKATEDGVQQISQYLKQRPKAKAIHVVSHGSAGRLYLGNTQLNSERLDHYGPDLEKWSTEDLLLYGCNVAVGDSANFVRQLSRATGARVAASANPTGNVKLGGDWQLGVRAGEISTSVVFNAETQKTYQGVFSEPNDTLAEATATGLTSATPGVFTHSGEIGDNPNVAPGLDVDLFKFDLDLGEQVRFPDMTIDLLDETGMPMGGAMVKLLDSTGMEATGGTSFDPSTYERIYRSELGGTYYIGVSGVPAYDPNTEGSGDPMYGDQLGDYTLNIETIGRTMGADEPNDTLTEATVTGLTSATPGVFTYSGEIGDNTNILQELDVDLFKFDLGLGEQVRFPDMIDLLDETGMPMGGAMVKLLDSTGMEVTDWTSDPSTYERIYRSELGGTYYVGISGVGTYDPNTEGSGDPMSAMGTGSYNLNIETIGRTMGADEPNDTLTEATDTGLTSATPGAFTYSGEIGDNTNILQELDVDLFKFDLGLGEQVRFPDMVDLLDETGSLMGGGTVKLLDSTGMEVMDWTSDPSTYERLYRSELGGTYYVGVSGVGTYDPNTEGSGDTMSGGQVGDYNLNIETIGRTMGTDEPNDTLTEATDTGLTSAAPGAFTYSGEIGDNTNILQELDVDLFKFDLGLGEQVRFPDMVDLLDETGSLMGGGTVKLLDSTGMEVMDWTSDPSTYERLYRSELGGTYYVGVSGVGTYDPNTEGSGDTMSGGQVGDYNLNIETIGRTMGTDEPNDTLTEATDTGLTSATPGAFTYSGEIGDNTNILQELDVDLFKFDLGVEERVRFPEFIDLLDETGSLMGGGTVKLFDDTGMEVMDWISDPSTYERIYHSNVGGTYYIGVSAVSAYDPTMEGSGDPMSAMGTGNYNLNIETIGRTMGADEPNDTLTEAKDTGLNSTQPIFTYQGQIGDNTNILQALDVDLFKFDLSVGEIIRFPEMIGLLGEIGMPIGTGTVKLFDSAGIEVTDWTFDPDPFYERMYQSDVGGTYYIGVSGVSAYDPTVEGSGDPMSAVGTGSYNLYLETTGSSSNQAQPFDFNADGIPDILWRNNTDGNNQIWLMNADGSRNTIAYPGYRNTNWQAVEVADFSNDGVADILWRNTTNGNNEIWLMNNDGTRNTIAYPGARDANWQVVEVANFSNDGVADILWRNTSNGNNEIWLMNNDGTRNSIAYPGARDANWQAVEVTDFSSDGVADILWRNTTNGNNEIWLMNNDGTRNTIAYPGARDTNWEMAEVADFSNDGVTDIFWRNTTNGNNEIWLMNNDGSRNTIAYPGARDTSWEVADTADFNGDNVDDIIWRNTTDGNNQIWLINSDGSRNSIAYPGYRDTSWSVADVADFSNDGVSDILWRNGTNGSNEIWLMNSDGSRNTIAYPGTRDTAWEVISDDFNAI